MFEAGHAFSQRGSCFRQDWGCLYPSMHQVKGRAWWVGQSSRGRGFPMRSREEQRAKKTQNPMDKTSPFHLVLVPLPTEPLVFSGVGGRDRRTRSQPGPACRAPGAPPECPLQPGCCSLLMPLVLHLEGMPGWVNCALCAGCPWPASITGPPGRPCVGMQRPAGRVQCFFRLCVPL